ncbi:RNA polymerase-associated protein LEO1 [Aphelenchoides bicaudatus]|nr:RNA polymerase-associated protein LEO1 [Aphelenchoides bicaudatus]
MSSSSSSDSADEVASNASDREENVNAAEVASNHSEQSQPRERSPSEKSGRSDRSNEEETVARELLLSDSEEETAPEPEIIADEIPSNRLNLGDLGPVFVRLPNFLSIEQKPFDERTYEQEMDDDEIVDVEGRTRMKLKLENTIRWRNVRDPETGEIRKESNAKIIKWSDGTMSLHLGNEIFEIQDQKAMPNLHLFTRQGASLQAQASFERKFAFRPHSTDTLTHRKMTMNMADKSNRAQKVKLVTDVGINPEKSRSENIKKEDKQIRDLNRKQAMQRRTRERTREVGISSGFLEGYDSDDENVGALKRSYSGSGTDRGRGRYGQDYYSESEDEESQRTKSLRETKQRIESSDEEIVDDNQDSRSASGSQPRKAPQTAASRRIIDDDE